MWTEESIAKDLRSIVGRSLSRPTDDVKQQDALVELGLDSVTMVELLSAIEERFRIIIPPAEIEPANFASLDRLTKLVARMLGTC